MVDGYVDLDPGGRPGLGAHVHTEFGVPVIGVAKTAFGPQPRRPGSARAVLPALYVTAAGMTIADAAVLVTEMAGRFRTPDALKTVDRLARTGAHRPRPLAKLAASLQVRIGIDGSGGRPAS